MQSRPVKISSSKATVDSFDLSWLLESLYPLNQNCVQDGTTITQNQTTAGTIVQGINVTHGLDILGSSVTHGLDILGSSVTHGQGTLGVNVTHGQGTLRNNVTTHGLDTSVNWDVFRSMYGGHSFITTKTTSLTTQLESTGQLCLPFSAPGELLLFIIYHNIIVYLLIVCSTEQSAAPELGDDLLDLILHEGTLDNVPLPNENRSSPDPMLELFSMPVKCSSPTHSCTSNPLPNAPPTDYQAPPTGTGAPCTEPEASLTDLPTDSLDWLLSQPQLDELDQCYDQFWLNHYSPSNSSAVSSVPSPQQPDSPHTDHVMQSSPHSSVAVSSELLEQYGCLHDHTYAAMEPKCANEEEKFMEKRRKNNLASQVSRAKRKRKYSTMFTRLDELQEENKRLKEELSIAEVEAAKLKKLIVGKLSAST